MKRLKQRPRSRTAPKIKLAKIKPVKIDLVIDDSGWRRLRGLEPSLRRAVRYALKAAAAKDVRALTLLLAGDEHLRALNYDFRGKNKATNVLSFAHSSDNDSYLGDIAIAYGVASREALAEGKPLVDHVIHLAVHGALHLLGYDHEARRDAEKMEALETKILRDLGIADPYAPCRKKAA
ncbi:MAG: rRNA maturation RNase YbeY [Proteobacteria bacterium]|nr:rRNA maturation RNase YbeY [Pseudomonadota bacterium]